jgi:hypothetical protein
MDHHTLHGGGLNIQSPHHPAFLQEHLIVDGLKRKTDDVGTFPVPLLTRSKSLEDLRESAKPKLKSLSTDMTGGSVCSFDASSLSPRSARGREGTTFPNYATLLRLRKDFDSESDIKKEIDSMSMRIEKLDVV